MTSEDGDVTADVVAHAIARAEPNVGSVLRALRQRVGLGSWAAVHQVGGDWVLLGSLQEGPGAPEEAGQRRWYRSVASAVADRGPHAVAAFDGEAGVGAYLGVPLVIDDELGPGVLCGADRRPQPETLATELPFAELLADLLAALLAAELHAARQAEAAEQAAVDSLQDPLTGLGNRRLWDRIVATEEERSRRHGTSACVIVVDLDGLKARNDTHGHAAGDELLRTAARAIRERTRGHDQVARIGGDEFAVLATDCGPDDLDLLVSRLRRALEAAAIDASLGAAARDGRGLAQAWRSADAAMYAEKARRRSQR